MSIERRIIERLNESRRLDESWPPILNQLSSYDKNVVRKCLQKVGIDIENTPYETVVITNGRDPRLKGNNVCIFEFTANNNNSRQNIGVWCGGKFIVDSYDFRTGTYLRQMSWKNILASATRIISIEFNHSISSAMKDKQAGRKEAQSGMVKRYTPKNKPKYAILDKSGYIVDPQKYKNMFAEMSISNGSQILQKAKEVYSQLAGKLDTIDWDSDHGFYTYDYIMREIPNQFAQLSKELRSYEDSKKKKTDSPEVDNWYIEYHKDKVTKSIKSLREVLAQAKKYL